MKNCSICDVRLKFSNSPTFGSGKLQDGAKICTKCFKKVNSADPEVAYKLKRYALDDVKQLLDKTFGNEDKIFSQITSLDFKGASKLLKIKEVKELPRILANDENVENIIQGTYNDSIGILTCTNKRLLFVDKGMVYGLKVEDFPLAKISSIQYETGLLLGKLKIHTSGNVSSIDNVDKVRVREFAEYVRLKIEDISTKPTEQKTINHSDKFDQLEKIGKLRDSGILTEDEFLEQKNKILNQ